MLEHRVSRFPSIVPRSLFSVTMAPEIIRGNTYAEQCDIYSWSIVFWQLLAKQLTPYDIQNMTRYGR